MTNQTGLSDEVEIFKYIPEAHIKSLLEKNNLYFSRVNRWPDMMELYLDKLVNPKLTSKRYGSCWTLHKGIGCVVDEGSRQNALESVRRNGLDSMWKTYCPQGGVRIGTTLGKVRAVLKDYQNVTGLSVQEGVVFYKHYKNVTKDQVSDLCFSKSPCFYTDDEYRFVITAADGEAKHLDVSIPNVAHFIDEILVSPPRPGNQQELCISNMIYDDLFCIQNVEFSWAEIKDRVALEKRKSCLYGKW